MGLGNLEYGNKVQIKTTNKNYNNLVVDGRSGFHQSDPREENISLREEEDFDVNKNKLKEKHEAVFNDNNITKYRLVEKEGQKILINKEKDLFEEVVNIFYR